MTGDCIPGHGVACKAVTYHWLFTWKFNQSGNFWNCSEHVRKTKCEHVRKTKWQ